MPRNSRAALAAAGFNILNDIRKCKYGVSFFSPGHEPMNGPSGGLLSGICLTLAVTEAETVATVSVSAIIIHICPERWSVHVSP